MKTNKRFAKFPNKLNQVLVFLWEFPVLTNGSYTIRLWIPACDAKGRFEFSIYNENWLLHLLLWIFFVQFEDNSDSATLKNSSFWSNEYLLECLTLKRRIVHVSSLVLVFCNGPAGVRSAIPSNSMSICPWKECIFYCIRLSLITHDTLPTVDERHFLRFQNWMGSVSFILSFGEYTLELLQSWRPKYFIFWQ